MKIHCLTLTLISGLTLATASAGPKNAQDFGAPAQSRLWDWFVGGSGGYLFDNETEFGAGHLGIEFPQEFAGFRHSLYLEIGQFRTEGEIEWEEECFDFAHAPPEKKGGGGSCGSIFHSIDIDLEVIPITANWKLEREILPNLGIYLGVGAGVAFVDMDVAHNPGFNDGSDDDAVFYGQVFGGLVFNVTENIEIFAGARGIYMDDPNLNVHGIDGSSYLSETDVLIEAGGRITF